LKRREKEVFQATLDDERALLSQIEQNYINALADIKKKIKKLQERGDTQSIAYQIQFQRQMEEQINRYLDILESENVDNIHKYLEKCYETGFIGNLYQLQDCDVNVVAPINQRTVIRATRMTADGVKLSKKIKGNTELLKKQVVQEMQRGFSTSMPYLDIARNISDRGESDLNRAMRIARTEGNRIYNEAALDSAQAAVKAGVDTVKQWVAILDGRTRESHQRVDGEWVELNDKFSNGLFLPGDKNAPAAEIVNCRCKAVFVPRWEVDSKAPRLRMDNIEKKVIEADNFQDWRQKYYSAIDKEWKELEEPFSNGLMYPGDPKGKAAEVINCRCSLDDVPRWYAQQGGFKYRRNNITGEIIECKNYAEFKEKYLKVSKGLSANGNKKSKGNAPELAKTIDYNNKSAIIKELDAFEKESINLSYERNCTITADGKVWHLDGSSGFVEAELIETQTGGSSLKGSYSYHNHPNNETHFSFSGNDVGFFLEKGEIYSKASDYKYLYIMKRTEDTLSSSYENIISEFNNIYKTDVYQMAFDGLINIDEDGYHEVMKTLSKKYKFEYERIKKNG
jgi:SPP1 gp7 family putative phage head morphogenesis protein